MTELIWEGKYKDGKKIAPVRMALPFQTIETVNESAADRSRNLDLFASGREGDWRKCVFNFVPCGNAFEKAFAKFLDRAEDVRAFSKLPETFGFAIEYTDPAMNLRNYYPDFVAVGHDGTHWLLETKGQQTEEVSYKDHAAELWCENATTLTGTKWQYRKVMQKAFENLHPESLEELKVLR